MLVLPLAIRVECNTVDGAEMTFDPAKLLFIGSMEEPEGREERRVRIVGQSTVKLAFSIKFNLMWGGGSLTHLASNFPILVEVVVTSMASCPPPITT